MKADNSGFVLNLFFAFMIGLLTSHNLVATEKLTTTAKLWQYESLCNLKTPPNLPDKVDIAQYPSSSAFMSEGCTELEKKYVHPSAVLLSIKNSGSQTAQISVNGFVNIVMKTKSGKKINPVAVYLRWPSPFGDGTLESYNTNVRSTWNLFVDASKTIDMIFLIPEATKGDEITVAELPSARIE